jgi:hypothetical protein
MLFYGFIAFLVVAVVAFGFQYSRYAGTLRDK